MGRLAGARTCSACARRASVGVADDRGAHPLAPAGVGGAEDGDVHDTGDLAQRVLDLERVDVDPAGDDQVGTPSLEVEVAVGVDASDVAHGERRPVGRVPPRCGRLLGRSEVGEPGVLRHGAPDAAVVVGGEGAARPGAAHRAGAAQPVLGAAGRELALGRAVELPGRAVGEQLDQAALDRRRARGRRRGRRAGTTTGRARRRRPSGRRGAGGGSGRRTSWSGARARSPP